MHSSPRSSTGSFNTQQLAHLDALYNDVCDSVGKELGIELTPQVRDAVAASIFRQAASGDVSRARLRSRAMRAVEAYAAIEVVA